MLDNKNILKLRGLPKGKLIQLLEFIDTSLKFSNEEHFCSLINRLSSFLPNDNVLCAHLGIENKSLEKVKSVLNISYPAEWLEIYCKNKFYLVDPVVQTHCATFNPQRWLETYHNHPGIGSKLLSLSFEYGILDGIVHGVFEPKDNSGSLFSFSSQIMGHEEDEFLCLALIIPYLHQAFLKYSKIKVIMEEIGISLPLSEREIEVLNWIKSGKTNWEISMILKISESTVKYHVLNILKKLNASSRGHAIAKALDLEIITL